MQTTNVATSEECPDDVRTARSDRDDVTCQLLREAASLETSARQPFWDEAVRINLPLADALARRYQGRGEDEEDLIQVARLALVKAVRRFDPDRGHFASFALPTVTGELKRHFRDRCWMVKPPRQIQEQQAPIAAAESDLAQKFGRIPSSVEIMDHLGLSREEVIAARAARGCFQPDSLDASLGDGWPSWQDRLGDDDPQLERIEVHIVLTRAFARLLVVDQELLVLRFIDQLTQAEIATRLGTNQVAISRRLRRVIQQLAGLINSSGRSEAA